MERTTRKHGGTKGSSAKALAIGMVATNGKIFGCGKNTGSKIFGCGKNTDGQQGEGHDDFKSIIETIPIIGGL